MSLYNTQPGSTTALLRELYPDDIVAVCEHCKGSCLEPVSTDPITECCNCGNQDRPHKVTPCELCAKRVEKDEVLQQ